MNEKALKYLKLAQYNADLFSKDPHRKVGSIILAPDFSRILATGTNGFPRQFNDQIESRWQRPTKYNYVSHAEQNAVCNAARTGTPLENSVIVVTMFPCSNCTKSIIQAGIRKVYTVTPDLNHRTWGSEYKVSLEMMNEVGMELFFLDSTEFN